MKAKAEAKAEAQVKELAKKPVVEPKAKPEAEELAKKANIEYKPVDVSKPSEQTALSFGMPLEVMMQEQGLSDIQKRHY